MKKRYATLQPVIDLHCLTTPADPHSWFAQVQPLVLEIGFGTGEFLVSQAKQRPECNFIGLEKNTPRIYKTINKICQAGCHNVRLLECDVTVFLKRFMPVKSLTEIMCLFPCPWPKKGHVKNRLFSQDFFDLCSSRLIESGRMFLVTDYAPYAYWVREQAQKAPFSMRYDDIEPRFNTKFERKWTAGGQDKFFQFQWVKQRHVDWPVQEDVDVKVYFAKDFDPSGLILDEESGNQYHIKFLEKIIDQEHQRAMVLAVVSEEDLMQHLWVEIVKTAKGWRVGLARGSNVFPTQSVFRAVERVYEKIQ